MQNQPVLVAPEPQLPGVNQASADYLENAEQLYDDLNRAVESALPKGSQNYNAVFVLLLHWQDDDLGTAVELSALEKVFQAVYQYNTEIYSIPSDDAATQLEYRLNDFRRVHDNGTNLLIIYYGGHSRLDQGKRRPSRSIWYANENQNGGATLVWSELQGILERAQSNVVFIMDCCHVPNTSACTGSKEGIWACNSHGATSGVNDSSFTRNLITDLKLLSESRFNIAMLHASLMRRYQCPGPYPLLTEPCYACLGSSAFPSIILEPQRENQSSAADSLPTINQSMTETLVLVTVRLKATEQMPTLSSWHNWYRHPVQDSVDAAHAFGRLQIRDLVKLEAHYQGNPDLFLLSMPIFIWHRLASSPPYTYVSLIKSTNLLFPSRDVEEKEKKKKKRKTAPEDPETLASMAKVAVGYKKQGRWKEARELEVEVMETRKRVLGVDHPETLTSMANLALTYKNKHRWMEAHELEVQVVSRRKRVLGEQHPDTLRSMNNLVETLCDQGEYVQAVQMGKETLALTESVFGKKHVSTLRVMKTFAMALRNQGKFAEAEEMLKETIALREKVSGKADPATLKTMYDLGVLLNDREKYADAENIHRETLVLRKRVLGERDLDTLKSMKHLAKALDNQGKYMDAEKMHREILALSEMVLGKEHSETLVSMNDLAHTLSGQGKDVEAISRMDQCFQTQNRILGSEHPNTKASLDALRKWRQVKVA